MEGMASRGKPPVLQEGTYESKTPERTLKVGRIRSVESKIRYGQKGSRDLSELRLSAPLDYVQEVQPLKAELETLYQDWKIEDWKKWWTYHEYLGMGIPSTLPEQMSVRVMFGNPFDNTIMIKKNGATIVQQVARGARCSYGKAHRG